MLGTAYFVVVAPVFDLYNQRQAALAQQWALEPHLRATAAEIPALRAELARLRESANTQKITLDGASDSIAAANLQSRIEELSASVGVAISSTEGLPAETRGVYRRIGLRIAINGSYQSIVKLLAAIETAAPPLILDNLQIHATLRGPALLRPEAILRARTAPQPPGPAPESRLDVGFEVYGFRNNGPPAVPKQ